MVATEFCTQEIPMAKSTTLLDAVQWLAALLLLITALLLGHFAQSRSASADENNLDPVVRAECQ
jgi:hypothetical protein